MPNDLDSLFEAMDLNRDGPLGEQGRRGASLKGAVLVGRSQRFREKKQGVELS